MGKDQNSLNRPISLLSPVAKLLEKPTRHQDRKDTSLAKQNPKILVGTFDPLLTFNKDATNIKRKHMG